eukprot:symbB.v1.2.034974.t1/scaffold4612.1/size37459/3
MRFLGNETMHPQLVDLRHCLAAVYVTYLACLKAACGTAACCQHQDGGLIHCANATAPVTGDGGNAGRPAHSKEKPLILVMQLSTKNLWDSFCQYTAAVNAQWAKSFGHRYLLTDGEYLRTTDLWRGGNVRAVLEVMRQVPREVEWIFHLDCDAVLVDFHQDALSSTIGASEMQVFLSRDESGFAGTSRLSNMGTGLWRRSNWTLQFLESWWQVKAIPPRCLTVTPVEMNKRFWRSSWQRTSIVVLSSWSCCLQGC